MKTILVLMFVSMFSMTWAQVENEEPAKKKMVEPVIEKEIVNPTTITPAETNPETEGTKMEEEESPTEMAKPVLEKVEAEPVPGAEIYLEQSPEQSVKKPKKKKRNNDE